MRFQYTARWLNGDGGSYENLHPDLPLSDVDFTRELGVGRLTATLPPEFIHEQNHTGLTVIREWATAIDVWLENTLVDSFIVTDITDAGTTLKIDCVGWLGYLSGMPWTGDQYKRANIKFEDVAAALVYNLPKWPGADIGFWPVYSGDSYPKLGNPLPTDLPKIPPPPVKKKNDPGARPTYPKYPRRNPAPKRPSKGKHSDAWYKAALADYNREHREWEKGRAKEKADYEEAKKRYRQAVADYNKRKAAGDKTAMSYKELLSKREQALKEAGRVRDDAMVKFNWWTTHDILAALQDICDANDVYMKVQHYAGDPRPRLQFFRDSVRRHRDITFVDGENVMVRPEIHQGGQKQGKTLRVLGAGEGDKMRSSLWFYPAGGRNGLNRVSTLVDKTLWSDRMVSDRASAVVRKRYSVVAPMDLTLIDSGYAPIGTFDVGDEIRYQTLDRRGFERDMWVLITEINCKPEKGEWTVRVSPIDSLE